MKYYVYLYSICGVELIGSGTLEECHFNMRDYLYDDYAKDLGFTITGNYTLASVNREWIDDLIDLMEDNEKEFDRIREYDSFASEDDLDEELVDMATHMLKDRIIADKETAVKFVNICDRYANMDYETVQELLVDALNLVYNKQYVCREIHGCAQGDYNYLYYVDGSLSEDAIRDIESIYFGTCSEYKIIVSSDRTTETCYDCTYLTDPEEVKAWIAEIFGTTKDKVKLSKITGSHTTYDYEDF